MKKLLKDQRGIGHIVLIIAAIIIVGGVGFVAYQTRQVQNKATQNKPGEYGIERTTGEPDPYAGWEMYRTKYEKLNFKYPDTYELEDTSRAEKKHS